MDVIYQAKEKAETLIATAFSPQMAYEAFSKKLYSLNPGISWNSLSPREKMAWEEVTKSFIEQTKVQLTFLINESARQLKEQE